VPLACASEINEVLFEVLNLRIGLVADMGIGLGWRSIVCVAAIWESSRVKGGDNAVHMTDEFFAVSSPSLDEARISSTSGVSGNQARLCT